METIENISLAKYTTFRIGGKARYFIIGKNEKEIINAIKEAQKSKLPFFILGGGSNLLISDRGFKGSVIKILNTNYKILNTEIQAGAGVSLTKLLKVFAENGLTGLEWAAGVPGTLGGAVYGAAGAFNGGIAEIVKSVRVYDFEKDKIKVFKNKDCQFAYRESIFKKKNNLVILSAELLLKKEKNKTRLAAAREKIKNYLDYRRSRQPQEPSAGSVFKNVDLGEVGSRLFEKFPEARTVIKENKLPAAYLIAHADLMGKIIGGAMVSPKHPNFIVNFKDAKARDVVKLIELIKKTVKEKFGLSLEEEIQYLGF